MCVCAEVYKYIPVLPHKADAAVDERALSLLSLPPCLPHNLSCLLGVESDDEMMGGCPRKHQWKQRLAIPHLEGEVVLIHRRQYELTVCEVSQAWVRCRAMVNTDCIRDSLNWESWVWGSHDLR